MSNRIKILMDSTGDLGASLSEKYDIGVFALPVFLGDEQYCDMENIQPDDLYAYFDKTGNLPRTAAPNTQNFLDYWKKWINDGYDIIHFNISSVFSGTYNAARIAAEESDANIQVIDSKNLSSGVALLAIRAAELRDQGLSVQEIAQEVKKDIPKVRTSFLVDNILYLWKGGRCSGVAALGANLLNLKPCIDVVDGKMLAGKKYRGKTEDAFAAYVDTKLKGKTNLRKNRIFITHSGIDQKIIDIAEKKIREHHPDFKEIYCTRAGCTVSTHCGPGTLGILFIDDEEN